MSEDSAQRAREAVARAREAMEELLGQDQAPAGEDEYTPWGWPDDPEPEEDVDVMEL